MKDRIKIDTALVVALAGLTIFLYKFPDLYPRDRSFDNAMDFLGVLCIFKGVLIRMVARGYKKANSSKGKALVTDGIYKITRNPMYLGSFYIGSGFVLILWPWWAVFIFALLFYLRFRVQVEKEEKFLGEAFPEEYKAYCARVPRTFPSFKLMRQVKTHEFFNFDIALSTKEKFGLLGWPVLAIILETLQEHLLYYGSDIFLTVKVFLLGFAFFATATWIKLKIYA